MTVVPHAHLLIIEDDPAVARSLIDGLERDGFRVTWKASGREGVAFSSASTAAGMLPLTQAAGWVWRS